jgi:hypothetical protein
MTKIYSTKNKLYAIKKMNRKIMKKIQNGGTTKELMKRMISLKNHVDLFLAKTVENKILVETINEKLETLYLLFEELLELIDNTEVSLK